VDIEKEKRLLKMKKVPHSPIQQKAGLVNEAAHTV